MLNLHNLLGIGCATRTISHLKKQQKYATNILIRFKSTCMSCLNQRVLINNHYKQPFLYQFIRNKSYNKYV